MSTPPTPATPDGGVDGVPAARSDDLPSDDVELTMVTMVFEATDPDALVGILAKYVVMSRSHPGCRNIDLAASATRPNRFVIVQKWESAAAQRSHFDSPDMVEMAAAASPLLSGPPAIDLLDTISAHDLA